MSLLKVYALAEEALPPRECTRRSCCCRFPETGREPFVTADEWHGVQEEIRRQGRRMPSLREDGFCPFLNPDLLGCSIYNARPLGCRTHFCREAGGPATARQMRAAIHLLNAMDEARGKKRQGSRPLTRWLRG